MNTSSKIKRLFCLVPLLVSILAACGPVTLIPPTPTSIPPQPTAPQATAPGNDPSLFQVARSYTDSPGDMEIGFLDVTAFQAAVNEEEETLEIILQMRDVPATAPRGQIIGFAEYMWDISVFLGAPASADAQPDYGFMVLTTTQDPAPSEGIQTPRPGKAEVVPIDELWDIRIIYDALGENIGTVSVTADPDSDTLMLSGHVPGITSDALLRFSTLYFDGTKDWPDQYVPSDSASLATPRPEATGTSETPSTETTGDSTTELIPVGNVRAYPGPAHYAGDVLTFEIKTRGSFDTSPASVSLTLDGEDPIEVSGEALFDRIVLPLALDTTNLSGSHTVKFSTADGALDETYSFEVLPASERPANETNAEWMAQEISCCVLHYISETAAGRDIHFLVDHFEQAAEDFATITGSNIDPKLDVYIIDTIWGNGGFGGNGELVISYTDRYYGPTIGGEGLETLARHEFTHAAGVGLAETGSGVEFNYEGLAVFVAGGHYKPEPLAERGAALYDLGHYVPVGQFLSQHELSYLYSAAMLTYIAERYGMEKMWQFLATDDNPKDDQPGSFQAGLQETFGISTREFDEGFQAWLESKAPGEQLDDLRLTVELQDLRRRYQETYAPPPYFLLAEAVEAAARPEYLPVVIREARAPANIAVELIIAHGQQAIVDGDYVRAEELNRILAEIVSTGKFEDPLAKDYLDIALAAVDAGYEVLNLDLQGNRAIVRVTTEPPDLMELDFQKVDGTWQIQP